MKSVLYKTQVGNSYKTYLLLVCLFFIPTFALADDSGKCGDGVIYTYVSATRTLTLSKAKFGSARISDDYWFRSPWDGYKKDIKKIIINDGVKSIGKGVFVGFSSLCSISIPKSVFFIDVNAFWGCSSLSYIDVEKGNSKYDSRDNCNAIIETKTNELIVGGNSTKIPESVISIADYAFSGRRGLSSVFIPKSVRSIGVFAFQSCENLTEINVENGNSKYDSRDNCNAIIESSTNKLYIGCKNTKIPNSVTSIGDNAFYSCDALTSVTIPNSVTTIGKSAFEYCNSLTFIYVPSSVRKIGNNAFSRCNKLSSIFISNGITTIGDNAFANCRKLEIVYILSNVNKIEGDIFWGCSELKDVYILSNVIPETAISFNPDHLSNSTLHVPSSLVEGYKTSFPWEYIKKLVAITEDEEARLLARNEYIVNKNNTISKEVDHAENPKKDESINADYYEQKNHIVNNDIHQKRIALVIGNADYQNITKLNSPIKDAEDVTSKLKTLGFEKVLLVRNASHQQMERALDNFVHKAQNYDVALVYYSGHGTSYKNVNYLLPIEFNKDSIPKNTENVVLKHHSVSVNYVADILDATSCPVKIMIIDACRSLYKSKGLDDSFAPLEPSEGTIISFSTSQNDDIKDGNVGDNSPYTKVLLKWLDRPNIEIKNMFAKIQAEVNGITGKLPRLYPALLDDFYFNSQ